MGHSGLNKIRVNGIDLYFEIYGEGEPLLLLHGFSGSHADWAEFKNGWSDNFQLIIPDLRSHGLSTHDASAYSLRQCSFDVWELLTALNIDVFKAIGLSGGGNILLHMATQKSDRLDAQVLVSATYTYPEQCRAVMRQYSFESLPPDYLNLLRKKHPGGDQQIRQLFAYARQFADVYDDINFKISDLEKITARTLLIQGDRDFLYPIDLTIDMYKAIPNGALWVVPNAGHVPLTENAKGNFIQVMNDFLLNAK